MKDFLTKEAVLLAFLPVISFIWALLFEIGYADSFGYSYSFIAIDLKVMIVSLAVSAGILIPIGFFYILFVRLACSGSKFDRLIALELIIPVIIVIPCCIAGFGNNIFNGLLIIFLVLSLLKFACFGLYALWFGWFEAVARAAQFEGLGDLPANFRFRLELIGKNIVTVYILILVALFISGLMVRGVGTAAAHWKSGYQTFVMEGKEYALIATYDDLVILGGVVEDQYDGLVSILPKNSDKLANLRSAKLKGFLSTF